MRPLLKVMAVIFAVFICIFILVRLTGLFTIDDVNSWLTAAKTLSPVWVTTLVIALLILDLFISIPTLYLVMLTGFILGPVSGFVVCLSGFFAIGFLGYGLGHRFGRALLSRIVAKKEERLELSNAFHQNAVAMILLSRALPMLPEVTACLSGMTRMPIRTFALSWLASSAPYIAIASYAGSISSVQNPMPAIYAALGLASVLWIGWAIFHKYQRR